MTDKQRVTFLDGPWEGQVRDVDTSRASTALHVPLGGSSVTYQLVRWGGVTYAATKEVRIARSAYMVDVEVLAQGNVDVEQVYQRLEAKVREVGPVIEDTITRDRRRDDRHMATVLVVEALTWP